MTRILTGAAAARLSLWSAALLLAPAAHAAATWTTSIQNNSTCTQASTNASTFGNSWTCSADTSGAPTVTTSAASTTGSGSTFAAAALWSYSGGMGVLNQSETTSANVSTFANSGDPNHALDNSGSTDVMVLNFSSSVALSQVSLGWSAVDSDISVLRYTGASAPVIVGSSISDLLSSGWTLVGNYADVTGVASGGSITGTVSVNASGASSSWWIISAYNSSYGGTTSSALTDGNDYIKVLSVAGTAAPATGVPEPTSLSLAGFAALALFGASKRSRRRAQAVSA